MATILPNALTVFRAAALWPILALLLIDGPAARWAALALYAAACLSDALDGWLARRLGAVSELGRMLDPIADKVLIGGLIVALCAAGDAPVVPAVAIVFREFLVSGLRESLASRAMALDVTALAKAKTALQMAALGFLLPGAHGPAPGGAVSTLEIGQGLLWLAAAVTLVTGWSYLRTGLAAARRS